MIHDLISADYRGDYKIEVCFDDGKRGIVDFADFPNRGGVFAKLRDLDFFKQFKVDQELGVLTWGGEIDIAPETLYSEATGAPLPQWMEPEEAISSAHTR